jgi:hypothetical protein
MTKGLKLLTNPEKQWPFMGGKKNYIAIDSSFGKPKFAVPANPQVTTTVPKAAMLRMLS